MYDFCIVEHPGVKQVWTAAYFEFQKVCRRFFILWNSCVSTNTNLDDDIPTILGPIDNQPQSQKYSVSWLSQRTSIRSSFLVPRIDRCQFCSVTRFAASKWFLLGGFTRVMTAICLSWNRLCRSVTRHEAIRTINKGHMLFSDVVDTSSKETGNR